MKAPQHQECRTLGRQRGEQHHCGAIILLIIILIATAAVFKICPGLALPLAPQMPRLHANTQP